MSKISRQEQILHYIETYKQQYGYAPSVREIGRGVGLASTSSVHAYLKKLQEQGLIEKQEGRPRTICYAGEV